MKSKMKIFALLSFIIFSNMTYAEDITIPVIAKPSLLQEGTQTQLSDSQISELIPWAKDSKLYLTDLLEGAESLSVTDKIDRLVEGIKLVVGESAPKQTELLMRYILNRALVVNETLSKEIESNQIGQADIKLRVLLSSINMAIKYYDTDMKALSKKSQTPFADFGIQYFQFLVEINKSIFDASAQYYIQRTALEWLAWDLYRDLNNKQFAPQIVKITNSLKTLPLENISDMQAITLIGQMRSLIVRLGYYTAPPKSVIVKKLTFKEECNKLYNEAWQEANGNVVSISVTVNGKKCRF